MLKKNIVFRFREKKQQNSRNFVHMKVPVFAKKLYKIGIPANPKTFAKIRKQKVSFNNTSNNREKVKVDPRTSTYSNTSSGLPNTIEKKVKVHEGVPSIWTMPNCCRWC